MERLNKNQILYTYNTCTRVIKVHVNTNAMLLSRSWKLTDRNHGCYHSNSPWQQSKTTFKDQGIQLLESLKHPEFPPFNIHTNNNNICIQLFFFNIRCLKIIKKKNLTHAKYDNYIIILSLLFSIRTHFQ